MRILIVAVLLAVAGAGLYLTQESWLRWFSGKDVSPPPKEHAHTQGPERVKLSPQAQANLGLVVQPVEPRAYWRSIGLPGTVVERRGRSDRSVHAPTAGVVKKIYAFPGDTAQPDAPLFELAVNSESLQTSQTELRKTTLEIQFARARIKQLEELAKDQVIPAAQLMELRLNLDRLDATRTMHRQDLATRGLSLIEIDDAAAGVFLKSIVVRAPGKAALDRPDVMEIEELKVQPGEQVQPGQVLCLLGSHESLYIEGRAFKDELPWLQQAAEKGWVLEADFMEKGDGNWPSLPQKLRIQFLSNSMEEETQSFRFYVPFANQHRDYERDGRKHHIWRFRPGQKVLLQVPVALFEQVFVLPAAAVVREGPEAYVWRQNGNLFERRPVHVLAQDDRRIVLANDGSIAEGAHLAQNAAAALNRVLKAQQAGGDAGHGHHGHSH
ncbi:MAG: hypothetical protein L0215_02645 [Gemmataceae bacterium]|nr:hypothetical protein [Gemmataceae bacterium]